ncbi:HAD domain-containing protein [Enterobacter asburiae]|nr:HAD domain-containing protein [Enterobacter asburiae]
MIASIIKPLLRLFQSPEIAVPAPVTSSRMEEKAVAGLWRPLPEKHVVLFLDFDGVCHPCQSETFEKMPLLERLLEECPAMVIVISSSWRECASVGYLRALFPKTCEDRLIGATSSLYLMPGQTGVRAAECEDFAYTYRIKSFICMDDDASLFPVGYPHLHRTDYYSGLTEADVTKLSTRYLTLMSRWGS